MSTFNIRLLAGERALITGTDDAGDKHKTIVSTMDFNARKQRNTVVLAQEEFDKAVEEFYAPIIAAAEAVNKKVEPVRDPAFFEVVQEETMGVAPKQEIVHRLPHDTVILNLIEAGKTDRLIWIDDTIEVLEYVAPTTTEVEVPELVADGDVAGE